ncbi:glucan biosynthesis protein C [Parabacteroides sp. PF5-5]|uniref:acyltransferase family protein n=1 Tax=unclassified Parabacteroides TaxID=2649774 RepID=UPI0024734DFE|nr:MULTISPECIES: acyltransferase [unclassified Parabacteroides]MDH6306510.1 glucan biosynthesis protein C [Parabacteroides sp. PH5-39]MDH6317477.1 glucan biosynthesis protein C [Parabacteroides sp. PF5-13]MDH6321220.1 glucan biosynthesis protein C [Parabacteroides sp. PH5-13]MDH6324952.1 glucan biosynthesis protein C [Parabacteroides sp. PH5-8]MDH6328661.1 glucan biosynthesis protein C [Parabacteroides sp. PH5-41]
MNKQILAPIPLQGRIDVFDFLRSLMIFFVIVLHVSMTYMLDCPPWWYVISNKTSPVFIFIVNLLDIFMMPVLFFISGYFTPASYIKKGTNGFLKDKMKHILLPWILGILVIIPLYPFFLGKSTNDMMGLLKENPFYLFNSQGYLWYLGILFLFLLAYTLYARFIPPSSTRTTISNQRNSLFLLACIVLSVICASLSTTFITSFDNWYYFAYVFNLKPAKIITYLSLFILGVYAWQTKWFVRDGWMPSISLWRILAIGTVTCYLVLRLLILPNYDFPGLDKLIPVFDAVCSYTTLLYLLLIGMKFQASRVSGWLVNISPYSYGIYWIHMPLTILYLQLINELNVPIFIKWLSGIFVTCFLSWLISKYILKKLPLLREMF